MLTNLSFLEEGKSFPPDSEAKRLRRYRENKQLFEDEHAEVYHSQFERIERVIGNFENVVSYATIFNFQKLTTLKIADFVFGSPPSITTKDDKHQMLLNRILMETDFFNKLYESAIDMSRYGDSVFQISVHNKKVRLLVTAPALWFPVVDSGNIKEFRYHVFCRPFLLDSDKKHYGLKVQIHDPENPAVCEERQYRLLGKPGSFKMGNRMSVPGEEQIETKFRACPVFRVSNTPTSDRCFGIDDYASIDSIVSELIIRVSQVSKVLDRFSSPAMTGPQSALTYNEEYGRWELRMADYYERNNESDPKPEMIVWDASLDANFKQIEILINMLYTISEMGSAVFGDLSHTTGNVASGTALRRLMMSPLAKAKRMANSYDRPVKEMLSLCAAVYGETILPEDISVKWNDGLPADPLEDAQLADIRTGSKATLSRKTAIQRLDHLSDNDADAELAAIEQDEAEKDMGSFPRNEPEVIG